MELNEEELAVAESALQWARRELGPIADHIDQEDAFPPDLFTRLGDQGYLGAGIPVEYGGAGGDLMTAALVGWALARVSPAVALSYGGNVNLCAHNLLRNGTPEQKRRYLPGLAAGKLIGAMALTEPNAGSDATSIRTTAIRTAARPAGDGYILNGTKMFITNGPIADLIVVYAKTAPELGKKGISAFLVEKGFAGFSVGQRLDKMGMRGSPTAELVFTDCEVPATNRLGPENEGLRVMMSGLDAERAYYSFTGVGLAEEAFALALRYATQREQFGAKISEFQLVQSKLAEMYARVEAARLLAIRAIRRTEAGGRASKEAAAAIFFAAETARFVTDQAVQIHGGYGYTKDYAVERFFRDAKLLEIGAGTQEIRRLVIAAELLGQRH